MKVSVIMPVYNEEKYIIKCVESLLCQDYEFSNMEWIFVDGMSDDKSKEILEKYQKDYPELIIILDNPQRIAPCAMNLGIRIAKGEYIIRLDAHAKYENDYISKCVYYLDTVDADNVGGVAETKSHGTIGNAIAGILSSRFGVGNSHFRINDKSGYVDTVPFGAFKKEVFHEWGEYDERLERNQDNEMNYRIRKNGGKIYLSKNIKFSYYSRDTVNQLIKMAYQNGKWNVITMKLCPGSMSIRHFVPLVFVISIYSFILLSFVSSSIRKLFVAELGLYVLLDIIFSIKDAKKIKYVPYMLGLFPIFHFFYGNGSFVGIVKLLFIKNVKELNNVLI